MDDVDYYQLLGVRPDVDADQLKTAYRQAVKQAHPDRGGTPGMFRLIEQAYQTLSDPRTRHAYDQRRTPPDTHPTPPDTHPTPPDTHPTPPAERTEPDFADDGPPSGKHATASTRNPDADPTSPHRARPSAQHPHPQPSPIWTTRRWWWQRRTIVVAAAAATGVAVWASRHLQLHHRLIEPDAITRRVDAFLSNVAVIASLATAVTIHLLYRDRWQIIGRLPPGAARFALPVGFAAIAVVAEAITHPLGWGIAAATVAAAGGVGHRWGRGPHSNWQLTNRPRVRHPRR